MAGIPSDSNGNLLPITLQALAIKRTVQSSLSSSYEITLDSATRFLRVYAISQDVYLRWGIEDCNANVFDEVIPAGQIVDLAVAYMTDGTRATAVNLIERTASATVIVIEK